MKKGKRSLILEELLNDSPEDIEERVEKLIEIILEKDDDNNLKRYKMNWTEPKPPTEGVSRYDHTICETPFGKLTIEWKSWKERASYDVMLNDSDWVGAEYDLESAKGLARNYLVKKHKELSDFLNSDKS